MNLRLPFLLLCMCLSMPRPAQASTFDISPISVTLSSKVSSAMLVVTNRGGEALRFHVSAFAWDESPDGEMVLSPTSDIVFFPALLTLNAGEARKLRVGMNAAPGASEKSYRVFVQELPPLAQKSDEPTNNVRVLTKMGVPIFVAGASSKPVPALGEVQLAGGVVTFQVKNNGTAHFRPEKLLVTAKAGASVVHTEEVHGWYVLAGHSRKYVVKLPKAACATLKSIEVELESEKGSAKATLADAHCTP